jgi:hypothetical protein
MTDASQSFELKITPDWLKESPSQNPYANYQGDEGVREGRRGKPTHGKGPRPGGPERRDNRDKRAPGSDRRPGRPGGDRRTGGGRRQDEGPRRQPAPDAPAQPQPAPVAIEFLPEPGFVEVLARQLKAVSHAYPLLEIARMFMAEPERQRIRLQVSKDGVELFQCGENGPVALDRSQLVNDGFHAQFGKLYAKEVIQKEEIRGNFTNVARCRHTGVLLGPTNHHTYQAALRRLYDERFSRRMSYEDFQRNIEIVTDPAVVEQWKEQARSVTVFKTLDDAGPRTFETEAEALRDFRERHFDKLVTSGKAFEISGTVSRALADRALFPAQMIFHIRRVCIANGLHVFRRDKNAQFVSTVRPKRFRGDLITLAAGVAKILSTLEKKPRCTRHELAAQLLPQDPNHPGLQQLKEALASNLHWLIHAGHVVEYHDGRLEIAPEAVEHKPQGKKPARPVEPQAAEPQATEPAQGKDTTPESPSATPDAPTPEPDGATSTEPDASPTAGENINRPE